MGYIVYIKNEGEWIPWTNETSYADALREMEYLTKYEGIEAMVA
jgi:hypothetical protein